jgi:ribosomal protein L12E/L44/L45/RPP1/RPP2
MAKLKVELEQMDWQVLLMLAGQGYQEVVQRVANQLNAAAPAANGQDRSEEPPAREASRA